MFYTKEALKTESNTVVAFNRMKLEKKFASDALC